VRERERERRERRDSENSERGGERTNEYIKREMRDENECLR
jgi:hypothetical protein